MSASGPNPGGAKGVFLRVRFNYADFDAFLKHRAASISPRGMFLPSAAPKPVDTRVRFDLQLADGTSVMRGEGTVAWTRGADDAKPGEPPGMGIRFTRLDDASRAIVDRAVEVNERRGVTGPLVSTPPPEPDPPAAAPMEGDDHVPSPEEIRRLVRAAIGNERVDLGRADALLDEIAKTVSRSPPRAPAQTPAAAPPLAAESAAVSNAAPASAVESDSDSPSVSGAASVAESESDAGSNSGPGSIPSPPPGDPPPDAPESFFKRFFRKK